MHGTLKPKTGKKILVVEDEPLTCQVIIRYLGISGYHAIHSSRGDEGLALAQAEQPDLVILDNRLPDMMGVDFARRLREGNGRIPIVLISAYELSADELKQAREIGIRGFLEKPFAFRRLKSILHSMLKPSHFHLIKKEFFYRKAYSSLTSEDLAREAFKKIFREGLDANGHIHFHVRNHTDHIILICSRRGMGKMIAKSPECKKGECIKWEDSSFSSLNPDKVLQEFSQMISLVRVDCADYEISWPTFADFLCWLELTI